MGRYINTDSKGRHIGISYNRKIAALIADGAVLDNGEKFKPNLVCIVHNGMFAAAAYAFDESEYKQFLPNSTDNRRRQWLIYEHAETLSK